MELGEWTETEEPRVLRWREETSDRPRADAGKGAAGRVTEAQQPPSPVQSHLVVSPQVGRERTTVEAGNMVLPCCSWADGRLREHALSASGETRRTAQETMAWYPWDFSDESTCIAEPATAESESAVRLNTLSVPSFSGGDCHWACHPRRFPCGRRVLWLATI